METSKPSRSQLAESLFQHVDKLAGVIGPRHPLKAGTMAATAAYIESQFRAAGLGVTRETFPVNDQPTDNVIVTIPGHKASNAVVILGAHYDSTPTTPGADDNGSAVAVLIETAHMLKLIEPLRTIRFVAFACEESPYYGSMEMGSLVHARGCRARGENVVGILCLEMVGYFVDHKNSQNVPPAIPKWLRWLFPRRGNFLAAVGNPRSARLCWNFRRGFKRGTRFPLFSIVLPESIREIHLSDQHAFWINDYPALMLTDTSFLRNPHYHQWSDTAETLDYERMADVTRGVANAVRHLAGE